MLPNTSETKSLPSFIKVTEVWIPNASRTRLELASGIYGELSDFQKASEDKSFAFDEGLPGKAWATGEPVVLREFNESNFKRTEAAKAAHLTCGIAFPVFAGEYVMGVVVFLCGENEYHAGAIEVWRSQPKFPFDIVLEDGYYGSLDDFAFISRQTRFRPGFGLPGLTIEKGKPVIMGDLGSSGLFARSFDASRAEITTAMAFPCSWAQQKGATIIALLSSAKMPIARRFEVWTRDERGDTLRLDSTLCSINKGHFGTASRIVVDRGVGVLGRAWQGGIPKAAVLDEEEKCEVCRLAARDGLQNVVVVPIIEKGELRSVVAWYF